MAERRRWPALLIRESGPAPSPDTDALSLADAVAALIDPHGPIAIEDLAPFPLPPGGLWDPTFPPLPDPPPAPLHWRVFFPTPRARDAAATTLRRAHHELTVTAEEVDDEDWAARSQRSLEAVTAGAFVVAPPWDRPSRVPTGASVLVIEPSRGFGTGHHASTRLCLRALSDTPAQDLSVLDLGTGSGVLAMAASLKGASRVVAIDVDPDAIEAARESHALNPHVGRIEWLPGDFRDAAWHALDGPWQIVLANLTAGMLCAAAERIRALVAPTGRLIASGFDESEYPTVVAALQLGEQAVYREEGWVGVVLGRV